MKRTPLRPSASLLSDAPQEDLGLSRREFLKLSAMVVAAGATIGLPLSACSAADRPVRRDITSISALPDINTLKSGIAMMKALPSSDLRNWTRQATIHNTHCRHHSWLFFPWHRAYLFYFEKIIQQLTGTASFGLPYWNWTADGHVPSVFWDVTSSLYDSNRNATSSDVADAGSVGASTITSILGLTNFITFAGAVTVLNDTAIFGPGQGSVESTPHNSIHNFVGGDMGTFMSPLDPIFWMHHNRVDELWVEWNILRNNPNTNSSDWANTEFTEFCDGHGNPVTVKVITTVLMPFLSYRFDTQPA